MRTLNPNTLERVENYITEYQKKNGKSPSYQEKRAMNIVGLIRYINCLMLQN